MTDDLTVNEAAQALGTSVQTVRTLLRKGELAGRKQRRGGRHTWIASRKAVETFLSKHGRFDGARRNKPSRLAQLEHAVEQLQRHVARLGGNNLTEASIETDLAAERDNLRARVVALEEALAHTRHAAELQLRADEHRAVVVEHLLAATAAAEQTDRLRREALAALDEAVAGFSRPGHLGLT